MQANKNKVKYKLTCVIVMDVVSIIIFFSQINTCDTGQLTINRNSIGSKACPKAHATGLVSLKREAYENIIDQLEILCE